VKRPDDAIAHITDDPTWAYGVKLGQYIKHLETQLEGMPKERRADEIKAGMQFWISSKPGWCDYEPERPPKPHDFIYLVRDKPKDPIREKLKEALIAGTIEHMDETGERYVIDGRAIDTSATAILERFDVKERL
jgi:hypothetical protein